MSWINSGTGNGSRTSSPRSGGRLRLAHEENEQLSITTEIVRYDEYPGCYGRQNSIRESGKSGQGQDTGNYFQGNHGDSLVKRVLLVVGVDHPQMFQAEVLYGRVHRAAGARRIRVFELKSVSLALGHHKQIQFGAGVGADRRRTSTGFLTENTVSTELTY